MTMGSVMMTMGMRTMKEKDVGAAMVGGEDTGLTICQGARRLWGFLKKRFAGVPVGSQVL